jgi:hypothetical protein
MLKRSRKHAAILLALSISVCALQMSPANASTAVQLQAEATRLQSIATDLSVAVAESSTVITLLNIIETATTTAAALTIANTESSTAYTSYAAATVAFEPVRDLYDVVFGELLPEEHNYQMAYLIVLLQNERGFDTTTAASALSAAFDALNLTQKTEQVNLINTNYSLIRSYVLTATAQGISLSNLNAAMSAVSAAQGIYNAAQAAFDLATIDPQNTNAFILISDAYTAQVAADAAQIAADAALTLENETATSLETREKKREAAIRKSLQEILLSLGSGNQITVAQLVSAGLLNAEIKNSSGLTAALQALSPSINDDLAQAKRVIQKFIVVEKISTGANVLPSALVEVELLSPQSKSWSMIMRSLRGMASQEKDTYEEIKAVVDAVEKRAAARKKALSDAKARNAMRRPA